MLKTAVIGVGSMGKNHVRVYNEMEESRLVAVCDSEPLALAAVSSQYRVPGYLDYREMLVAEKPDAVSIAVPTTLHEEVALHALQAGSHVLVEKPIAATLEQSRRLIACAEASQRLLMIGHIVRFNPALRALKAKLEAGHLGRIFQIVCCRVGPYPSRDMDVSVAIDLAPHDIDIMRYLTGLEPLRVYAETAQRIHTDHEDLLLGLLSFPGGITASLEINWLTPTKRREIWVLGEHGLFKVDDLTQDLYFYENAQVGGSSWPSLQTLKGVSEGEMTRYALLRYEPLKAELQAFLKAIQEGSQAPVSGQDGLDALRLALALLESARRHQAIEV
jgi:UDP-N-acetylglucosamine 3-dehydrogenase